MDTLTKEEVRHVASLARIEVTEEEIEIYQRQLKSLFNEVEKIKEVEGVSDDLLITPVEHVSALREDVTKEQILFADVKKNAPRTSGNYIEVPVMVHE